MASTVVLLAVVGAAPAWAQDLSGLRQGFLPADLAGEETTVTQAHRGLFAFEQEIAATDAFGSGDDQTAFTARLRAGYAAVPSVTPFVESEIARLPRHTGSFASPADKIETSLRWRAGIAFDPAPSRHGELTLGYGEDHPGDSAATLRMLTFGGSLVWTPTAFTRISLEGASTFGLASDDVASGSVTHDGSIDLSYAWNRDITLVGSAAARRETNLGSGSVETSYAAGFSATWRMDQSYRFTAAYEHAWQRSTDAAGIDQSDSLRLELRMQR